MSNPRDILANVAETLLGFRSVLVVGHERPDADSLGSTLALAAALRACDVEAVAFSTDGVPERLQHLVGSESCLSTLDATASFDATVVVDCGYRGRVGASFPSNGWGKSIVVVDHHQRIESDFADVELHVPGASSTAELIYRLMGALGVETSREIAWNLLAGIHTDTGGFSYETTAPETLRVAASLMEAGVDMAELTRSIYEQEPEGLVRLRGEVIQGMTMHANGRLAVMTVSGEQLQRNGIHDPAGVTFVNSGRAIQGVEVSVQLREGSDATHVSLRAKSSVDVSKVAARFGGGGHRLAAGCSMAVSLAEAERMLVAAICEVLDDDALNSSAFDGGE